MLTVACERFRIDVGDASIELIRVEHRGQHGCSGGHKFDSVQAIVGLVPVAAAQGRRF
jgi:hypothetical protein